MMGYSRAGSLAEGRAFSLTAEVGFCQRRFDLFAVTQIPFAIVGEFSRSAARARRQCWIVVNVVADERPGHPRCFVSQRYRHHVAVLVRE